MRPGIDAAEETLNDWCRCGAKRVFFPDDWLDALRRMPRGDQDTRSAGHE
jgi:hypothetical protein